MGLNFFVVNRVKRVPYSLVLVPSVAQLALRHAHGLILERRGAVETPAVTASICVLSGGTNLQAGGAYQLG